MILRAKLISPSRFDLIFLKHTFRDILRFSFANYFIDLFLIAPSLVLPTLIVVLIEPEYSAYFYIAWMFYNVVLLIPKSIADSMFADMGRKDSNAIFNIMKRGLVLNVSALIPIIVIVIISGSFFLRFLGEGYLKFSYPLILWLILPTFPYIIVRSLVVLLKVHDQNFLNFFLVLINSGVFIIVAVMLIDDFDLFAIAIGWFISQFVSIVFIIIVFYIHKPLQSIVKPSNAYSKMN